MASRVLFRPVAQGFSTENDMNVRFKKFGPALAGGAALVGSMSAHAVDPADALAALGTLTTSQGGYGPVLYGLAIASVAIMIGIKWIKRGRGAA